jgi:hypothetical protein
MPQARRSHRAIVYNHEIWLIGGAVKRTSISRIDIYNPMTNTYRQPLMSLPYSLCSFGCELIGQWLIIIGGERDFDRSINLCMALDLSKEYLWSTSSSPTEWWFPLLSLPTPGRRCIETVLYHA